MEDRKMTEARQLAELVAYQKDAIVSSVVVTRETGSVTVFAFDRGQGLSEHTTPFEAFVYVAEGQVEITIAGTPHLLKSGDMIVMPANIPHAVKAVEAFKMLLVMLH
jgi:quercetin dioxygenase-like cupin family protein